MDLAIFLEEDEFIDYSESIIQKKAKKLFKDTSNDIEKVKIAFEFVRDEIPHSLDIDTEIITIKASDVLRYKTGICHTKSNLLAALLRSQNIPTGFCFQHLTLLNDDSEGYCLYCFNAVYLNNKWIKLDARGNKKGVNAQFSLDKPILAFYPREEYDEYFFEGIYSSPDNLRMKELQSKDNLSEFKDLPDTLSIEPAILK